MAAGIANRRPGHHASPTYDRLRNLLGLPAITTNRLQLFPEAVFLRWGFAGRVFFHIAASVVNLMLIV